MGGWPFDFALFVLSERPAGVYTVLIEERLPPDPSSPDLQQVTSLNLSYRDARDDRLRVAVLSYDLAWYEASGREPIDARARRQLIRHWNNRRRAARESPNATDEDKQRVTDAIAKPHQLTVDGQHAQALMIADPPLRAIWTEHEGTGLIVSGDLSELAALDLETFPVHDTLTAKRALNTRPTRQPNPDALRRPAGTAFRHPDPEAYMRQLGGKPWGEDDPK